MLGELLTGWTALVVLLVAVALLQLAAFAYTAGVVRSDIRFGNAEHVSTDSSPADGPVTCPECGTENEPDYRFCRNCVRTLPGGVQGRFTTGDDRTLV